MGRTKSNLTEEDKISKGKRVRHLREKLGFSRPDLGRKYGINPSTLRSTEIGLNGLTLSLAKNLCLIANDNDCDCTIDWLMEGKGDEPKVIKTNLIRLNNLPSPVVDEKLMQPFLESQSLAIAYDVRNFLNSYKGYDVDVFRVCDDAMTPQFKVGDHVGGLSIQLNKIQNYLDSPIIFEIENGEKILRSITKSDDHHILYGTNYNYNNRQNVMFDPTIVKAFPVFWHRRLMTPWMNEL